LIKSLFAAVAALFMAAGMAQADHHETNGVMLSGIGTVKAKPDLFRKKEWIENECNKTAVHRKDSRKIGSAC
jgi:uncharacterized protein YggE